MARKSLVYVLHVENTDAITVYRKVETAIEALRTMSGWTIRDDEEQSIRHDVCDGIGWAKLATGHYGMLILTEATIVAD